MNFFIALIIYSNSVIYVHFFFNLAVEYVVIRYTLWKINSLQHHNLTGVVSYFEDKLCITIVRDSYFIFPGKILSCPFVIAF